MNDAEIGVLVREGGVGLLRVLTLPLVCEGGWARAVRTAMQYQTPQARIIYGVRVRLPKSTGSILSKPIDAQDIECCVVLPAFHGVGEGPAIPPYDIRAGWSCPPRLTKDLTVHT